MVADLVWHSCSKDTYLGSRGIIWQNFAGTLAVHGLGIVLAGLGFLNPLLAAFIHVFSELLFILNSTRLLPGRGR